MHFYYLIFGFGRGEMEDVFIPASSEPRESSPGVDIGPPTPPPPEKELLGYILTFAIYLFSFF